MPAEVRLTREMRLIDVTMIGVGAMIGAGIFVLTGIAAGVAGPALILVFLLNGVDRAPGGHGLRRAGGGHPWRRRRIPLRQAGAARPQRFPRGLDELVRPRRRLFALRAWLRGVFPGTPFRARHSHPVPALGADGNLAGRPGLRRLRLYQLPRRLRDGQGGQRHHHRQDRHHSGVRRRGTLGHGAPRGLAGLLHAVPEPRVGRRRRRDGPDVYRVRGIRDHRPDQRGGGGSETQRPPGRLPLPAGRRADLPAGRVRRGRGRCPCPPACR